MFLSDKNAVYAVNGGIPWWPSIVVLDTFHDKSLLFSWMIKTKEFYFSIMEWSIALVIINESRKTGIGTYTTNVVPDQPVNNAQLHCPLDGKSGSYWTINGQFKSAYARFTMPRLKYIKDSTTYIRRQFVCLVSSQWGREIDQLIGSLSDET